MGSKRNGWCELTIISVAARDTPFNNIAQVIFRCGTCYKRLAARDRCLQGGKLKIWLSNHNKLQIQILNQEQVHFGRLFGHERERIVL